MSRRKQEVNIYRIAEEAGVSIATVSRVMNRRVGVSEATRSRINEMLRRYEFTPDYPEMRTAKVAFLVPWDDISDYFRRAIRGACRYACENNIEINIIIKNGSSEESLLARIRDQQCSGVIVALGDEFQHARAELSATELPCVFMDTSIVQDHLGYVDNDSYAGSLAAARHLIELGHRKIGYIRYDGSGLIVNHRRRYEGYLDAMAEAGLTVLPHWVVTESPEGGMQSAGLGGKINMTKLLRQAPELTAVMTLDDQMAMGAMTAIHQAGLRIPEDISVTGFDNATGSENWFPALTTVDHPLEEAGYLAAEAVHTGLRCPGEWKAPQLTLPTRLIVRNSTGPVRKSNDI